MAFRVKRTMAGFSQVEVAKILGVSNTTVSMWEAGKSAPRADMLPLIAKLYNCTVDELLEQDTA